ncbi:hypothetical protein [Gracilibacillus sp. JCM 18860]|uniref:hypothetical protein n=1 Tax=Gracilibacillus sp. JCM 18860 TaxID=1306159 RepID=UPI0006D0985E
MDYVKFAVEEADKRGMHVILYDEAMYPSGAANGKVVEKNPQYGSRGLYALETDIFDSTVEIPLKPEDRIVAVYLACKDSDQDYNPEKISCIFPLNAQIIQLRENIATIPNEVMDQFFQTNQRNKEDYRCIALIESYTFGTIRGIHANQDDGGEVNAPRSADLLNPEAVESFMEITHERYRQVVGEYFGGTIFAMFTDEPDITGRNAQSGGIAWTNNFERYVYQEGVHVEDLLGLFFSVGEKTDDVRQKYEKAVNKRLMETYYIPIANWCQQNNLHLTGHPAKSDDIELLEPFTIPGQDVVWRWVAPEDEKGLIGEHSTAGKCGADLARHFDRRRNLNEYLGVCGVDNSWNLSAADMKWYTDWLAVRGVNLFCPHAFYYSIKGRERSHERPPDVGPNNAWWPYYHFFSTYIKRVSWLMTDSVNQAEIAILASNNHLPWKMAKYFFQHQIEFNYLHESLFTKEKIMISGDRLNIGNYSYQAVVIDEQKWLEVDQAVKQTLTKFTQNGGKVYWVTTKSKAESMPDIITVSPDDLASIHHYFSHYRYAKLSNECPNIRITKGNKSGQLFYFMTNEGEELYKGTIKFSNDFPVEEWNPWTGSRQKLATTNGEYQLELPYRESVIWIVDSSQGERERKKEARPAKWIEINPRLQPESNKLEYWDKQTLSDWSKTDGLQYFSGTMTYPFVFDYQGDKVDEVTIDLGGEVYEIAEVSLNHSEPVVKMWPPYKVNVPGGKSSKRGKFP